MDDRLHEAARALRARWAHVPLAIAPRWLAGLMDGGAFVLPAEELAAPRVEVDGAVAVVPVVGPMVYRHDWVTELLGFTSYEDIAAAVEDAFTTPGVGAVVLALDTPGGEVRGLFETAEHIRAIADEAGKPLLAVADTAALSAGYALAVAADRVLALPSADLGSIGVVAAHMDVSAADEQQGVRWTFIAAGERKLWGNPHMPLAPEAAEEMRRTVQADYDTFVRWVAARRGLRPEAVRATEAGVFRAPEAVRLGLADGLVSGVPSLARRLNSANRENHAMAVKDTETALPEGGAVVPDHERVEGAARPAQADATRPDASDDVEARVAKAVLERAADIAAVVEIARRAGVKVDMAEALRSGVSGDALARRVLEELARRHEESAVVTSHAVQGEQPDPLKILAERKAKRNANA